MALGLLICVASFHTSAQIAQGTVRLGPDVDFASSTIEAQGSFNDFKTTQLDLGLSAGYFVVNNLELALGVGISNTKTEIGNGELTENGFFIGPQLTYMVPASEVVFIPISVGLGYNSITSDTGISEVTYTGMRFGGDIGLEYIVSRRIGARLSVGADFGNLQDDDSEAELDQNGFAIGLGVNFYL
jgi:hypothetical protein